MEDLMSPPEIDAAVHQQLGALDAKMDRVLADQDQARSDRKQQYSKSENLERRLDDVDRKLETVNTRLNNMEPITTDIGKWRERFIGMRLLIVFVAAAFGASAATFGKWMAIKLGWV
jgi:tetrahydromethanopterin S-methyltransferase subunit G